MEPEKKKQKPDLGWKAGLEAGNVTCFENRKVHYQTKNKKWEL